MKIASISKMKKALDVVVMNIGKASIICDYFVICSAKTKIHTRAIADSIEKELKELGVIVKRREGKREGSWILLDYESVVAHIFLEEQRRFYDLEDLWSKTPLEPV